MNASMTCSACGERAKHELPKDSHGRFTRALLFGIGGAILGLIIYAVFTITTGLIIGYVSLSVGIRIAWKLAAGIELEIFGPFENTAAASSGAARRFNSVYHNPRIHSKL